MTLSFRQIAIGGCGRRGYLLPWHEVPRGSMFGPDEIEPWWPGAPRGARVQVHRLSRIAAESLLRAAFDDSRSESTIRAFVDGPWIDAWSREQVVEHIAKRLVGGELVLVELLEEGYGWAGTGASAPRRVDDGPELRVPAASTFLRVKVVLDDGANVPKADVTLTAPDGKRLEGSTSQSGELELAEVLSKGTGQAVILPRQTPRWRWGAEATATSEQVFDFSFDAPIAADVATGATNTIVLRRPEIERVDGSALGFSPGSAVLVPLDDHLGPTPALATALGRLRAASTLRLLVVGHASADGSTSVNEALARRRAECVRHLLVGDRDAWVALATDHGSPADMQRLLRYLARVHDWPTEPTRIDGTIDARVEAAVSGFQLTYNRVFEAEVLVDGVIGVETLGALFDVQRHELRHQLAALEVPEDEAPRWLTASGLVSAGARVLAHPGIPQSSAAEGQRRVDLLLIDDLVAWREPHGIDRLYDVARFRQVELSPKTMGRSDLVVQLVDHYGKILAEEPYRVITDEEEREGTSDDQGVVVERGLYGKHVRLVCGEAVIVLDEPYLGTARQRHALVPPCDDGDDDDAWREDSLPAADEDDEDDELDDDDGEVDAADSEDD